MHGYGESDGAVFRGNDTAVAWVWSAGGMGALAGKEVAIAVTLSRGARLYSIRGRFAVRNH